MPAPTAGLLFVLLVAGLLCRGSTVSAAGPAGGGPVFSSSAAVAALEQHDDELAGAVKMLTDLSASVSSR